MPILNHRTNFKFFLFSFLLFLYSSLLGEDPAISVDLNSPTYQEGLLTTESGGVIESSQIRIQARKIFYKHKESVIAEGDLLIQYGDRFLTGERLEYDFKEKKGFITKAHTFTEIWFIYSEVIHLNPDHTFSLVNASITTSENSKPEWGIYAKSVLIGEKAVLKAKNVTFRLWKIPILWLPAYSSNLRKVEDPPVRYQVKWNRAQGAKASIRYRFFSRENLDLFFRFDARLSRGLGGAIESEYLSDDKETCFLTKNYLAHDTFLFDNDPNKKRTRYRLQGFYKTKTEDERWKVFATWDRFNDKNMPRDFKSDDFELNTAKRTRLFIRNQEARHIVGINLKPRINSFQGFKQELPEVDLSLRPFELFQTGALFNNRSKISYLDYAYSDEIGGLLSDFHSFRLETDQSLIRPFSLSALKITPFAGFRGIFYSDSPQNSRVGQALFQYGGEMNLPLKKTVRNFRHFVTPYLSYHGFSKPTFSSSEVYIFDLQDGYHLLNVLRPGIKSTFYTKKLGVFTPAVSFDLYSLGFFADETYKNTFPKLYLNLNFNQLNLTLNTQSVWNFEENLLDRFNLRFLYTYSQDFAVGFEYRHRSRFDWRKDDHNNFILDVTRNIDTLLNSPLSDGRNAFLTKMEWRFLPGWRIRLESHSGFGRKEEPGYTEVRAECLALITSGWELGLAFKQTIRGPGFAGFTLNKR